MSNSNIETLKQIIADQKTAIEELGGTVVVTNTQPSPTDITNGIKSIPVSDFSNATALPEDVLIGKTYYAGDKKLKTGTRELPLTDEVYHCLILQDQTSTEQIFYELPGTLTEICDYFIYKCKTPAIIRLPESLQKINYAGFKDCSNFIFDNFPDLPNLTTIGSYAMFGTQVYLDNLPESITDLQMYSFYNTKNLGNGLIIPPNVSHIENYVFGRNFYPEVNDFYEYYDESGPTTLNKFTTGMLEHLFFNCDFHPNPNVTEIPDSFNYAGSFNNIYIPAHITRVGTNAFGNYIIYTNLYHLNSVIFSNPILPTFGNTPFQKINLENVKFYVPDGSEDEYKTVTQLSLWKDLIYPASQRE